MLGSGLFGTVVSVGEKQIVLDISPGAQLTVLKQAIGRVVQPSDEDDYTPDQEEDEEFEPDTFDLDRPAAAPALPTEPAAPVVGADVNSVTSQPTPEPVGEPESRRGTANSKE
jgi:preprotein translocase subunit YajC